VSKSTSPNDSPADAGTPSPAPPPRGRAERLAFGCAVAVSVAAVVLALFGIADSDFFWHVRTGELMLESRALPGPDLYSHTARGDFYAYYSWLAEVAAALLHRLGGIELIVLAKALASGLIFVLLYLDCRARGARGLAVPWALLYGLLLVRFRLYARPEIFSLLLIVLVDLLAVVYLERGSRWILALLPVLTALWSNLHPYVILGVVVLATHAGGEALDRALRRPATRGGSPALLGGATLLALVTTLLNPYGVRIYLPALKLRGSEVIARMPTREWLPPSWDDFALFYVLAAVAGIVVLLGLRRARLRDLALWAGMSVLALGSLRNVGVFALITTPILARHLTLATEWLAPGLRRRTPVLSRLLSRPVRAVLLLLVLFWVTGALLSPNWSPVHLDQSRHYRFGAGLSRDSAPVDAVEFIEKHALKGPLFNSWAYGGYVIWRSWPRLRVSLDGRQMIYEPFLAELQSRGLIETLRRFDIRLGLVELDDPALLDAFRSTGRYEMVFFDDLAAVFVHRDALGSLTAYAKLRPEDLSLGWLVPRDAEQALNEAERATDESPRSARAWALLGGLARRQGQTSRCIGALRRAVALESTQTAYRNQLGAALLEAGLAEEALTSFGASVRLDRRQWTGHYNRGLALVELGRERDAFAAFRKAAGRGADRAEPRLMLGAMERDPRRARAYLEEVLALSDSAEIDAKARRLLRELDSASR